MMCYYNGGTENYMTKPGLFLHWKPEADIQQYSFKPDSENKEEPLPELGGTQQGPESGTKTKTKTKTCQQYCTGHQWLVSDLFPVCVLLNSRFPGFCS